MHYGDTYLSAKTLNTVKLKINDKTKIIIVNILFLLKVIKNIALLRYFFIHAGPKSIMHFSQAARHYENAATLFH